MLSSVRTPYTPNFCGSSMNQSTYNQTSLDRVVSLDRGWTREQWMTMILLRSCGEGIKFLDQTNWKCPNVATRLNPKP